MKILLTGSQGFLGRHIKTPIMQYGCLRFDWGTSIEMVERYEPDVAIHLAWEGVKDRSNEELQSRNIKLVKDIQTHTNAKWIVAGSQAEINTPNIPYAIAKTKIREYLEERVPTVWVRIYSMYGTGDAAHNHIPMIINACLRNENIPLTDQNILWDYLFVQDAADAFINLLNAPPDIYELGSGRPVYTQDVARMIKEKTNSKSELQFGARPRRPVEIDYLCANIDKISPYWKPRTSFMDGLDQTIEYFRLLNH